MFLLPPYPQPAFVVFYFPDNSEPFRCGKIELKVLLIFIFLMDVQHPCAYIYIYIFVFRTVFLISLMICSFTFSGLFLKFIIRSRYWLHYMYANTFSPILWLFVHSAGSLLRCAEVSQFHAIPQRLFAVLSDPVQKDFGHGYVLQCFSLAVSAFRVLN